MNPPSPCPPENSSGGPENPKGSSGDKKKTSRYERSKKLQKLLKSDKRKRRKKKRKFTIKKGQEEGTNEDSPDTAPSFNEQVEDLVAACGADTEEVETTHHVNRDLIPLGATKVKSWYSSSLNYSVKILVTKETIKTEQVSYVLNGEEKVISASKEEQGPAGSQVKWEAIARLMILAVNSAMPIFRIDRLLVGAAKIFNSANICRWFKSVAESLIFLYIYLGEELAEASVLNVDDTKTRCIQMERLAKNGEPEPNEKLILKTKELFGRQFDKKAGKGKKKSLMLTHVTGDISQNGQKHRIHFFRTHFGSAGNLLDKLLDMRSAKNRDLTLQSDLSSQNLPSLYHQKNFDITLAGCGAHARRPFWRYSQHDEELTDYFLKAFLLLAWVEKKGSDPKSLLHQRQKFGTKIWHLIYERALEVVEFRPRNKRLWPKSSKIYSACQYIVKNYSKLTAYLSNPDLSATNNLCERMLRSEKMLLVSCKFRKSEVGRVVFDIFRTIIMTATANKVSLIPYITWLLKNSEHIENKPDLYTPWAYRKLMQDADRPSKAA